MGNLVRAHKFLLVEGKIPKFHKFQLRVMETYKGTCNLVWEEGDMFMSGQLCELLFDDKHVYCILDDGSLHITQVLS